MADLIPVAASVLPAAGFTSILGTAGEALTAGQLVYLKSDGKYWKADADNSATTAAVDGIVLSQAAAATAPVLVQTDGDIVLGCATVIGEVYVASDTAGGIKPHADLASGDYLSIIGYGTTITNIHLRFVNTGYAKT